MKPQLKMELSLTMLMALLSACSPKAAYAEVPPPTPAPTLAADVEPDTADQKVEAVSNEEAQAGEVVVIDTGEEVDGSRQWTTDLAQAVQVETVNVIDQLVEAYLSGEIDNVGDLSSAELAEFSKKVTEKKNADRGINVLIFDDGSGNPAFIDPNHDNKMMEYDGNAGLAKTIEMFVPIAGYDEAGNLQFEVDGQIVTTGASAGVKWGAPITEYGDPRIEWPVGTDVSKMDGLTTPERVMGDREYTSILIPAVLLEKNLGQIYVTGQRPIMRSTFRFLVPETDSAGHPLYAREVLVTGGVIFRLYEEGSDLEIPTSGRELDTNSNFYKNLTENWTYYFGSYTNQKKLYGLNNESLDNYQGLVNLENTASVLSGEQINEKDMLVSATSMIIKAKVK